MAIVARQPRPVGQEEQGWDDIVISPAADALPVFPDGAVLDVCVVGSSVRQLFDGTWRLELKCAVLEDGHVKELRTADGELVPVRLPLFCKLPSRDGPRGPFKPAPLASKFYRLWVFANGGRKPLRRDRMSLSVFKGRLFRARTRLVTHDHRGPKRGQLPACLQHSVIDEFIP